METNEAIEKVKSAIEQYHQDHWQQLYPAGQMPAWVLVAVAENILKPMQDEIDELKKLKAL